MPTPMLNAVPNVNAMLAAIVVVRFQKMPNRKTAAIGGAINPSTDWNTLNSSYKCNGIHINNLFKFFVWCEVSKSFTRSII